ncbi:MAG: hypothetical protein OSJ62_01950 [Lachnospiraceae bacterium]|nr:hypothetical protein [Lachnospiraceae bacterium]
MPKKPKNQKKGRDVVESEEKSDNKLITIIFAILTILVWLAIFCVMVKLDVNGFGSKVMRPIFKDVPIINLILPGPSDEELVTEENLPYQNLSEALDYIKELELQIQGYQEENVGQETQISELQAAVERLQQFEQNQQAFQEEKDRYYQEVVLGNNTEMMQSFREWYENMDPETAERIYNLVIERFEQLKLDEEYVQTFEEMDAVRAAAIFVEMSGDLDTVVKTLRSLNADTRSAILSAIASNDAVFAAKLTQLLAP